MTNPSNGQSGSYSASGSPGASGSHSPSGVSAEASSLIAQMNQDYTNALSAIDNQQNPVSFVTAAATAANQATQDYWNDIDTELSSLSSSNPATMTTVMAQIQSDLTGIQSIMQAQQAFAEAETEKSFQLAQQYGNVGGNSNSGTGTGSYTGTGRGKGTGYRGTGYGGVGYGGVGYRGTGYRGTGYGSGRYGSGRYGSGRYGSGRYGSGGLGGLLGGGGYGSGSSSLLTSMLPMMMMMPMMMMPMMMSGMMNRGGGLGGYPGGIPPGGIPGAPPGQLTSAAPPIGGPGANGAGSSLPGGPDAGSHLQPISDTGTQPAAGPSPGNPVPVANMDVKLPDGTSIQAPNGQAATAVRAAMDGANPSDAYQQAGVTLPPPGTPILNPIAPGDLQTGDIGVWKDHQVMALGGGKVLLDGQVQPESSLGSSPDFLGWMRPTQSSQAPPAAPPPAPAPPATATAASVPTGAGPPPS
jgi:hypothetical protein